MNLLLLDSIKMKLNYNMKKLSFVICFICIGLFGFSQVKVVAPNGHTGIGPAFTTGGQTPAQKLHVNGNTQIEQNSYVGLFIKETSGTGAAQLRFRTGQGNFVFDDVAGTQQAILGYNAAFNRVNIQSSTSADFSFVTNNQFLWWAPNGRLGVGTSTPARNLHVIGNAGKTDGTSTWDVISDKRLKSNIDDYEGGLAEIMKIRPVTFNYDGRYGTDATNTVVGVVAQEVEKVAPYMVKDIELEDAVAETKTRIDITPTGEEVTTEYTDKRVISAETFKSINNDAFTYMLINSVQEQQAMIEDLKSTLETVKEELANIKEGSLESKEVTLSDVKTSSLGQNSPNPYHTNTTIEYAVANTAKSAVVQFFNNNGQVINSVNVNVGKGQLNINTGDIPSGTYTYSLVIDGKVVDTKRMVITK